MRPRFSNRADHVMESYIMQLISVANRPGMISFATGLPDRRLFDTEGIRRAAEDVLGGPESRDSLQYGTTEGLPSLREKIASRCRKELAVDAQAEDVFITNGSQECFDHMGKLFLDPGDAVAVENPGYLGALQSLSVYAPRFEGVDIHESGPDISMLEAALGRQPKLYYAVPNFQNPSGMSYPPESRIAVAEALEGSGCLLIEDDAYGELGFRGRPGKSIKSLAPEDTVLTGSFSKIISPGLRVGWMVVPDWLKDRVRTSIEATCLHSGSFSQRVIDAFLERNDLDAYLRPIRSEYGRKKRLFLDMMEEELPDTLEWNNPEGGMFVWLRTPEGTDAMRLYEAAMARRLVVMPGRPFHVRGGGNTLRLNFATPDDDDIITGMRALRDAYRDIS
ncbi:MAG: PLP-dependent aminotransferase family protein [Candidatus Methanomethylophilaceae archaeon]|nr:PLP-dependent aminotransferase family protein [Candidatus Methanomethylophilaceae archaeon]NLF34126.1 PLP-dependent aminotransferase family protein [Thermoplasmatales archaeon]